MTHKTFHNLGLAEAVRQRQLEAAEEREGGNSDEDWDDFGFNNNLPSAPKRPAVHDRSKRKNFVPKDSKSTMPLLTAHRFGGRNVSAAEKFENSKTNPAPPSSKPSGSSTYKKELEWVESVRSKKKDLISNTGNSFSNSQSVSEGASTGVVASKFESFARSKVQEKIMTKPMSYAAITEKSRDEKSTTDGKIAFDRFASKNSGLFRPDSNTQAGREAEARKAELEALRSKASQPSSTRSQQVVAPKPTGFAKPSSLGSKKFEKMVANQEAKTFQKKVGHWNKSVGSSEKATFASNSKRDPPTLYKAKPPPPAIDQVKPAPPSMGQVKPPPPTVDTGKPAPPPPMLNVSEQDPVELPHSLNSNVAPEEDRELPSYCYAMYDFGAQEEGDLSFVSGDMILKLSEVDVDWWSGRSLRTGCEGIFPRNLVSLTQDSESSEKHHLRSSDTEGVEEKEMGRFSFKEEEETERIRNEKEDQERIRIEEEKERLRIEEEERERLRIEEEERERRRIEEEERERRRIEEERERRRIEEEERERLRIEEEERERLRIEEEERERFRLEEEERERLRIQEEEAERLGVAGSERISFGGVTDEGKGGSDDDAYEAEDGIGTCVVLFDFSGREADELDVRAGEYLEILFKVDESWLSARKLSDGSKGLVPRDYCEIQTLSEPAFPEEMPNSKNEIPNGVDMRLGTAMYEYSGDQEGDLCFQRGETIVVLETIDENWAQGRNENGDVGVFPLNWIEMR